MKKLLSILTAIGLSATAGISTIACSTNAKIAEISMSNELLSLLEVYDKKGNSNINVEIMRGEEDHTVFEWGVTNRIHSARWFLNDDGSAKTEEAGIFLKKSLGLSTEYGLFDRQEVQKFDFVIGSNINVKLEPNQKGNDIIWHYGSVDGYWKYSTWDGNPDKKIGVVRGMKIKSLQEYDNGVSAYLPGWRMWQDALADFDKTNGSLLADFYIGASVNKEKFENIDITNLLDKKTASGQRLLNLVDFLGQGLLKITTKNIERAKGHENDSVLVAGDRLNFTISIGAINFNEEGHCFYLKESE